MWGGIMGVRSVGSIGAGMVVLALAGGGCGYDRGATPTGPGYGDTASMSAGRSEFRVFSATGDIVSTLAEFRGALGDPANGGTPGPLPGGRREIKWDAAPADMPGNFFNTNVRAGAIFTTDGTGFRNSDADFSEINPAYADDFNAFSLPKTFMPLGSAELTVDFRIPGLETRASTRGFGVVFSDVERGGAASIKLFDAEGRSLGQYHAPVRSDPAGFSFVGVVFESPLVAEVRITSGQAALGANVQDLSDGGNRDLVVMDDYLYAEPQPLP
ncbi:MAG TPA: hypothetical protein VMY76_17680 [Gemmatimonadales bacterium]|nr:hypothetical protein [Gemmatimonadales bacterium]